MRRLNAITTLLVIGCLVMAAGCEATGRAERVGEHRLAPQPAEAVTLHFEPVDRPYVVVARVETEARTRRFGTIAETEAAALDKLRELAGRYGARDVIDIEQQILRGEQIVEIDPRERGRRPVEEHTVRFTGKGVVFR